MSYTITNFYLGIFVNYLFVRKVQFIYLFVACLFVVPIFLQERFPVSDQALQFLVILLLLRSASAGNNATLIIAYVMVTLYCILNVFLVILVGP